jgi:hypothetical protein
MPLYSADEQGLAEIAGSAVFLQIGTGYFLVTAGHVFDINKTSVLYFPTENKLVEIAGVSCISTAPQQIRQRDEFDCGFLHVVCDALPVLLKQFWPLPMSFVDVNDTTNSGEQYSFCGYSQDLTAIDTEHRQINAQCFSFTSTAVEDRQYRKLHLTKDRNIVINFHPRKAKNSSGEIVTPFSPHGLSGGAVWKYSRNAVANVLKARLVGIPIEYDRRKHALIATRINFVLESIRIHFPHLSTYIPASTTLDVTVQTN